MQNKKTFRNSVFFNFRTDFIIIFFSASAILIIKLIFSYIVYGTNDITYLIYFSDIIQRFGTFKIYSLVNIYNHPPLISWTLKFIKLIEIKNRFGFPFLFRLLPIFADYTSVFVIWKLLSKYQMPNKVLICLICIINPINFLVSGFHGNVDPVFIFFILLAIYFVENNHINFAGVIYGLSMCIKIVPVILVPVFFFYLKNNKDKIRFFITSLILPLIVFLPYLVNDYYSVVKNIFLYSSLKGIWGFSHIFKDIFLNENININIRNFIYGIFKLYINFTLIIFFIIIGVVSRFLTRYKKTNLLEEIFLTFCLFLTVTPGFGVQYLSWLSFFAVIIFPVLGTIYLLLGGIFLWRVYAYWGGAAPPYYANSIEVGQWIGFEKFLDIILWLIIVTMLIKLVFDKVIPRNLIFRKINN
jgi:Gpi18-like mannosyltransferase